MRLTQREVQVLRLLRDGLRNGQIATRLGVSEDTIKNTLTSAYRKLGVSNRQDAAAVFTEEWDEFGRHLGPLHMRKSMSDQGAEAAPEPPGLYRPPEPGFLNSVTAQSLILLVTVGGLAIGLAAAWVFARTF